MLIDRELLDDCLKQKRSAQNRLYKEVFSFLMNICIRYKNDYDSAGESLNIIFLKVLTKLESFKKNDASFVPWMKRIAVNHLIDEYRKEKREKEKVSFLEEVSISSSPRSFHQKEAELDSEYLLEMVRQLPSMTAKVFNLYAVDGFKHREIAEMLDMSENTSKWHLREARKKLQAKLEAFNETKRYERK